MAPFGCAQIVLNAVSLQLIPAFFSQSSGCAHTLALQCLEALQVRNSGVVADKRLRVLLRSTRFMTTLS